MIARVWAYFSKHPFSTIFLVIVVVSSMLWDFSGQGTTPLSPLLALLLLITLFVAPVMVLMALGCALILLIRGNAPAKARRALLRHLRHDCIPRAQLLLRPCVLARLGLFSGQQA